jgi:hypothetical protein
VALFSADFLNLCLNVSILVYVVVRVELINRKIDSTVYWWKLAKEWWHSSRNAVQDGQHTIAAIKQEAAEMKRTAQEVTQAQTKVQAVLEKADELKDVVKDIPPQVLSLLKEDPHVMVQTKKEAL